MEIQLWRQILCPYELAVKELTVKFNHLIREHHEKDLYSPITQVTGRVKSVSSILDKLQKKNIPLDKLEDEIVLTGAFCSGRCNRVGVTITVGDDVYTGITPEGFGEFWENTILPAVEKAKEG